VAGRVAEKASGILSIDLKEGRTGPLGIGRVALGIVQEGALCLHEEQDIVYREAATGTSTQASGPACPEDAQYREVITPDPVMLFRFSALTYNAHRIHYDRDYATRIEGYGGLVVHGPLSASLLARFATEIAQKPLKTFAFKGLSPLLDDGAFTLEAKERDDGLDLWVRQPAGGQAMQAKATF
ncbi:hypothetical protein TH25_25680, partial [Thalassospira profundimaris]